MADLHAFHVVTALPCKQCRYDLQGLHADGRCPECGLEILETIAARVDPELAFLPALKRPRATGAALLALGLGLAAASMGTSASAAALFLSRVSREGWRGTLAQLFPPSTPSRLFLLPPMALIVAALAAAALLMLCETRTWRRYLLLFGLGAWLTATWFPPEAIHLALTGVIAMLTIAGLGPVMADLGRRSRIYRRAAHAQQAIGPLTAAMAIGVLSVLSAEPAASLSGSDAATLLRLIAAVCLLMTNVGMLYLLANTFWICRSLWSWQPLLARVVDRSADITPPPTRAATSDSPTP